MLSLYRAWLPPLCLTYPAAAGALPRPAPPPGAHRPIPRRATATSAPAAATTAAPAAPSPAPSDSSELDVEELTPEPPDSAPPPPPAGAATAVLDIACCDGPVRFSRVLNESWSGAEQAPAAAAEQRATCARRPAARHAADAPPAPPGPPYYPCKTCGCRFPSYYFVHKHRKRCHPGEDAPALLISAPAPAAAATNAAAVA